MSPKQAVLDLLARLPDDCTIADIEYHVHILRKVQLSEEAAARGEVYSQEEAKALFAARRAR